jgi:hypothetical protein
MGNIFKRSINFSRREKLGEKTNEGRKKERLGMEKHKLLVEEILIYNTTNAMIISTP